MDATDFLDIPKGIVLNLPDGYLSETVRFAIEANKLPSLQNGIYRLGDKCLARRSLGGESRVVLSKDFAPYSFFWEWEEYVDKEWRIIMVGGLIYHGDVNSTYSTTLEPTKGWAIHT